MYVIKLSFADKTQLDALLHNQSFFNEISHLTPNRTSDLDLLLTDPVPQHDSLDTEVVVLSMFARAFKRLFFRDTKHEIEFLTPYANALKGGLRHHTERLIVSTDVLSK